MVLDTGIFISGLIHPRGSIGAVLRALRDGKYNVLYSNETLIELIDVLGRDIFHTKYHITPDNISTLILLIRLRGEAVIISHHIQDCRDPQDNKFLQPFQPGEVFAVKGADRDLPCFHPGCVVCIDEIHILLDIPAQGPNDQILPFHLQARANPGPKGAGRVWRMLGADPAWASPGIDTADPVWKPKQPLY